MMPPILTETPPSSSPLDSAEFTEQWCYESPPERDIASTLRPGAQR